MLGGILADDMGLGKTLTMIASIVGSLLRAEDFAQRKLSGGEETRIPVKSTLVIVPSVCSYPSPQLDVIVAKEALVLMDGWLDEIEKYSFR